jgi:hypothetical protein
VLVWTVGGRHCRHGENGLHEAGLSRTSSGFDMGGKRPTDVLAALRRELMNAT